MVCCFVLSRIYKCDYFLFGQKIALPNPTIPHSVPEHKIDCPIPIFTYKIDLYLIKKTQNTHTPQSHWAENLKLDPNTMHADCGHTHTHTPIHMFQQCLSIKDSSFSFSNPGASSLPPLLHLTGLACLRGTWRHIRRGSETACNSPVHFSVASSEPVSIRWPS